MSEFLAFNPVNQDDISDVIDAVLEGGPADFPSELRTHRVARTKEKIKVCFYGGYEHFERETSQVVDGRPVVFHWTDRTRIAE